jgi:hypothetical protein
MSRRIGLSALLLFGSLAGAVAQTTEPQSPPAAKTILVAPPTQWTSDMLSFRPALSQTTTDFAALTGGIVFGMVATDVNAQLAEPTPGLNWSTMPLAGEFPEDVRYFWTRLEGSQQLAAGITGCAGANSYVVFLFRGRGLFRVSYRLVADAQCPNLAQTATDLMARYVQMGRELALSVHYRAGRVEVVDITDPSAGYLIPMRWQARGR